MVTGNGQRTAPRGRASSPHPPGRRYLERKCLPEHPSPSHSSHRAVPEERSNLRWLNQTGINTTAMNWFLVALAQRYNDDPQRAQLTAAQTFRSLACAQSGVDTRASGGQGRVAKWGDASSAPTIAWGPHDEWSVDLFSRSMKSYLGGCR